MPFRPQLRRDVVFDGEASRVRDTVLGRSVSLGEVARAVVERLDGRTVDEIVGDVHDRESVEHAIRTLILLNLIDGAGDPVRERLARLRAGAPLPHVVLDGARFECQGSGECCQNYNLGPLTDEDIARLERLDIAGAFPAVGPGPYHRQIDHEGEPTRFLRSVDDRCIFLQEDARCGIHARFGAAAKPDLCRVYPLEQLATLDGIKLYDKGSCASFARSARRGLPLVEQLPQLRALLPRQHALFHPIVFVGPDVCCDYGHFTRLLDAQLELVRHEATPPEQLRAAARLLGELSDALARCPLAEGEPDATIDTLLAQDPARLFAPARDPSAGAAAIAGVAEELIAVAAGAIASAMAGARALGARLAREIVQLLHVVQAIAIGGALPDYYAAIAAMPLEDPGDFAEALGISMRQQLFGWHALVDERARPAILRIAFVQLCALTGARLRAVVEGLPAARADDLSYGHMLATRVLDMNGTRALLVEHEADALTAIEALPRLVGWETP